MSFILLIILLIFGIATITGKNDNLLRKINLDRGFFTKDNLIYIFSTIKKDLGFEGYVRSLKIWLSKDNFNVIIFIVGVIFFFAYLFEFIALLFIIFIIYFLYKGSKIYRLQDRPYNRYAQPEDIFGEQRFDYIKAKESLMPILKKIGIILSYAFLMGIVLAYILFEFYIPKDLKKEIGEGVLTSGFEFRFYSLDYRNDKTPIADIMGKQCAGYVNIDLCEKVIARKIIKSQEKTIELYGYCKISENAKKQYCLKDNYYFQQAIIEEKKPELQKELGIWKNDHLEILNGKGIIDITIDNSISYSTLLLSIKCNVDCSRHDFQQALFSSEGIGASGMYQSGQFQNISLDPAKIKKDLLISILDKIASEIQKAYDKTNMLPKNPINTKPLNLKNEIQYGDIIYGYENNGYTFKKTRSTRLGAFDILGIRKNGIDTVLINNREIIGYEKIYDAEVSENGTTIALVAVKNGRLLIAMNGEEKYLNYTSWPKDSKNSNYWFMISPNGKEYGLKIGIDGKDVLILNGVESAPFDSICCLRFLIDRTTFVADGEERVNIN